MRRRYVAGSLILSISLLAQLAFAGGDFDREVYPSGFKPSDHCERVLEAAKQTVFSSIREFKSLSVADKIKTLHAITHKSTTTPSWTSIQLQDLAIRLRLVSELNTKQLSPYAEELFLIGVQVGHFIEMDKFPELAVAGFASFLEELVSLPVSENQDILMLKTGVQANLAEMRVIQLKFFSGSQKAEILDEATQEIMKTMRMGYEAGGHVGTKWLRLPLLLIKLVMEQFNSFDDFSKPRVRQWMSASVQMAFDQPEEIFLRLGHALPKSAADLILEIYEMPQSKDFPEVRVRCSKFFELLEHLVRSKNN